MDLDNFLNGVTSPILEATDQIDDIKETEKFIKSIKKVRFNALFKNINRIHTFMIEQGATVRGLVKKTILTGAMKLFEQSRERSQEYRKKKNDLINKYSDSLVDKIKVQGTLAGVVEDAEFERMAFEKIMEQVSDSVLAGISNNDQLTFFVTQFLKTDMLQSPEERKYHDRAIELIEYFVIQTMLLRIVLSCIQTIIARVVSKIKLSKTDQCDKKAEEVGKVLIKFFKTFVEHKFGAEIGKYLSTYVEDYYQSTDDDKKQFTKFENLVNILLGIKQA